MTDGGGGVTETPENVFELCEAHQENEPCDKCIDDWNEMARPYNLADMEKIKQLQSINEEKDKMIKDLVEALRFYGNSNLCSDEYCHFDGSVARQVLKKHNLTEVNDGV